MIKSLQEMILSRITPDQFLNLLEKNPVFSSKWETVEKTRMEWEVIFPGVYRNVMTGKIERSKKFRRLFKLLLGSEVLKLLPFFQIPGRIRFEGLVSSDLKKGYGSYRLRINRMTEKVEIRGFLNLSSTPTGIKYYLGNVEIQYQDNQFRSKGYTVIEYEEGKWKFIGKRESFPSESLSLLLRHF